MRSQPTVLESLLPRPQRSRARSGPQAGLLDGWGRGRYAVAEGRQACPVVAIQTTLLSHTRRFFMTHATFEALKISNIFG